MSDIEVYKKVTEQHVNPKTHAEEIARVMNQNVEQIKQGVVVPNSDGSALYRLTIDDSGTPALVITAL